METYSFHILDAIEKYKYLKKAFSWPLDIEFWLKPSGFLFCLGSLGKVNVTCTRTFLKGQFFLVVLNYFFLILLFEKFQSEWWVSNFTQDPSAKNSHEIFGNWKKIQFLRFHETIEISCPKRGRQIKILRHATLNDMKKKAITHSAKVNPKSLNFQSACFTIFLP